MIQGHCFLFCMPQVSAKEEAKLENLKELNNIGGVHHRGALGSNGHCSATAYMQIRMMMPTKREMLTQRWMVMLRLMRRLNVEGEAITMLETHFDASCGEFLHSLQGHSATIHHHLAPFNATKMTPFLHC